MGVEKTLFEFHLDTFLLDEQDLDIAFRHLNAISNIIKRHEAFFKTKSLFYIEHNPTKNYIKFITRGEAVTCVNPRNFICLWGMYYSPDTEIFYANKSDVGAIPILSLATLEKRLQFKIRNDFFKKALAYKISGNIANFFETEDDEDVDNFQLLISCLQNSLQESQVDINQVKKTLMDAVFVCTLLINNLRVFFTLEEDWLTNFKLYGISASFVPNLYIFANKLDDLKKLSLDNVVDINITTNDVSNSLYRALNKEEIKEYFIKSSSSIESAEKAVADLLEPLKLKISKRALNSFNKSEIEAGQEKYAGDYKDMNTNFLYKRGLLDRRFSVIFNKISKSVLNEVS